MQRHFTEISFHPPKHRSFRSPGFRTCRSEGNGLSRDHQVGVFLVSGDQDYFPPWEAIHHRSLTARPFKNGGWKTILTYWVQGTFQGRTVKLPRGYYHSGQIITTSAEVTLNFG